MAAHINLDLPFDISKVFFVMTANTLDTIPQPLLDRMEVVRLAGYSEQEKLEIARRYQIPKQLKEADLSADCLRAERRGVAPDGFALHPRGRREPLSGSSSHI